MSAADTSTDPTDAAGDAPADPARRRVTLKRTAAGRYAATNARGGRVPLGTGENDDFTPVELLLAAVAGCTAVDVDAITARRAEPTGFRVEVASTKVDDADGHHLGPVRIVFDVSFPDGEPGDAARAALPVAVQRSHDRLCTVSRTVMLPTPVESVVRDATGRS